jgi:hypothetical protein
MEELSLIGLCNAPVFFLPLRTVNCRRSRNGPALYPKTETNKNACSRQGWNRHFPSYAHFERHNFSSAQRVAQSSEAKNTS